MDNLSDAIRKYYRNKVLPDRKIEMILDRQTQVRGRSALKKGGYWAIAAVVVLAAGVSLWRDLAPVLNANRTPAQQVIPKPTAFEHDIEPTPRFNIDKAQPIIAVLEAVPDSTHAPVEKDEKVAAASDAPVNTHRESSRKAAAPASANGLSPSVPAPSSGSDLGQGYGGFRLGNR